MSEAISKCTTCGHEWPVGEDSTPSCGEVLLARLKVFEPIIVEQMRQNDRFLAGKEPFTAASRTVDDTHKLRLVTKKFGDVARAVEAVEKYGKVRQHKKLEQDLVEMAAVLVTWIESLVPRGTHKL